MRRQLRWVSLVAIVAVLALALFACGQATEEPPAETGEAEPAPEPTGPQPGGTFTFARQEDTESLDPHNTTTVSSAEVDYLIYDTLVVRDFDMSIKPGLATEWSVSDDGTVYTFKLQEGVKFHSGDPFTAEDVKFTFDRWKNFEGSPTAYQLGPFDELVMVDDYTVEFHLTEPYAIFLDALTGYAASILNKSYVEEVGEGYGTTVDKVDGTGPFIAESWTRQDTLTLVRNDEYTWGPAIYDNQGPAYLEKIVMRVIPEDATRLAEVESGSADFTPSLPPVDVSRLEQAGTVELYRYTDLNTNFIGFNLTKSPLDDIRFRKAAHHAVNKEEIVEGAYYGMAEPALGHLAPNTWGWWPEIPNNTYLYDVDEANSLLDEMGWTEKNDDGIRMKDGAPLHVVQMFSPGPAVEAQMSIIQEQMRQVGIEMELQQMEWTAYLAALRASEQEMWLMGVRYTNADNLYFYFHSKQIPAPNRFLWNDARTDELLDLSRTSTDDNERLAAYQELQKIVYENALEIPLVHENRVVAYQSRVHDIRVHSANVLYKLMDANIVDE